MNYSLFSSFAHRYDVHTPPDHYQNDHQLVLDIAKEIGTNARILDVGCGTGVLVRKARQAGYEATGLDISEEMISIARESLTRDVVRTQRMQDIDECSEYDLVVSLSWCLHYCADEEEIFRVLCAMWRSLRPSGRLLLQVAHGANLPSSLMEDKELGPDGLIDDVSLKYRFRSDACDKRRIYADYEYSCTSRGEAFAETHILQVTDAFELQDLATRAGFVTLEIWNSYKRDSLTTSGSVFLTGLKPE